jgi:chromate transport protein ChrA
MLKLLAPLLTSLAAGEVGLAVKRIKRNAAFGVVIALFSSVAVIFLLVAAYIALADRYGDMRAALTLAAGSLVLAVIAFVAMKIAEGAERKRQRDRTKVDTSALLTMAALAAAPVILRSRALMMLAIPIAAFGGLSLLSKARSRKRPRRNPSANSRDV